MWSFTTYRPDRLKALRKELLKGSSVSGALDSFSCFVPWKLQQQIEAVLSRMQLWEENLPAVTYDSSSLKALWTCAHSAIKNQGHWLASASAIWKLHSAFGLLVTPCSAKNLSSPVQGRINVVLQPSLHFGAISQEVNLPVQWYEPAQPSSAAQLPACGNGPELTQLRENARAHRGGG